MNQIIPSHLTSFSLSPSLFSQRAREQGQHRQGDPLPPPGERAEEHEERRDAGARLQGARGPPAQHAALLGQARYEGAIWVPPLSGEVRDGWEGGFADDSRRPPAGFFYRRTRASVSPVAGVSALKVDGFKNNSAAGPSEMVACFLLSCFSSIRSFSW